MTIDTADQAMVYLNEKKQFRIEKVNKDLYQDHLYDGEPIDLTAREVIKLAKAYTSENKQSTSIKKNVKHFSNGKNRSKTRDALKTEDFDKIPGPTDVVAEEDIWGWD